MKIFVVNKDVYYFIKLVLLKEIVFEYLVVCICKVGLFGVCSYVGGFFFIFVKIKGLSIF